MYSFNPYYSGRWSRTNEGDILIFPTLEVLILIVVDNGLIRCLMELSVQVVLCLNPCCSGRWSRTATPTVVKHDSYYVLILVVVEDGLVPDDIATFNSKGEVLILVVVEDGLVRVKRAV